MTLPKFAFIMPKCAKTVLVKICTFSSLPQQSSFQQNELTNYWSKFNKLTYCRLNTSLIRYGPSKYLFCWFILLEWTLLCKRTKCANFDKYRFCTFNRRKFWQRHFCVFTKYAFCKMSNTLFDIDLQRVFAKYAIC